MDVLSNSVLVLNASYEAINVCSAKRALVLVCKGAAIVQEKSVHVLRTPSFNLPLPAVIRLVTYRDVPRRLHTVSRKGIMVRDGFTCQYCRTLLSAAKLTLDHVTPKSRGGKSTWENLVACCTLATTERVTKRPQRRVCNSPDNRSSSAYTPGISC